MNNSKILVTGATGTTGTVAVDLLLAKGLPVRALVHAEDVRAARLRARGVETVVGNLRDFAAVRVALQDIKRAYFVYPLEPQILNAVAYFSEAALEAGVEHIVSLSQRTARKDSPSHDAQDHWFAERAFDRCGIPVTHLRPTLFMEWLLYPFQLPHIRNHGKIVLPGGDGRHSPVSGFDQGRVIAAILMAPAPHGGKTYNLYGPEEMTYSRMADLVSEAIGKKVRYAPESLEEFRKRLEESGLEEFRIQHLVAVFTEYRNNMLDGSNDLIERLTGEAPISVRDFVIRNIGQLRPEGP